MKCANCHKDLWFSRRHCPFCKTDLIPPPRPRSVTVIGGILLLLSVPMIFHSLSIDHSDPKWIELRESSEINYYVFLVTPWIALASGIGSIQGYPWGRWLFIAWYGPGITIMALNNPSQQSLVNALVFGCVVYCLLSRPANLYFNGVSKAREPRAPEPAEPPSPPELPPATITEP